YKTHFERVNKRRLYPGHTRLISDYEKISTTAQADMFFENYGVGNTTQIIDNPFERQVCYEILLKILKYRNPTQYKEIHKGTPYYYIGWTSYQYGDIIKAIFYMDAAVSEDLKFPNVQNRMETKPSLEFFLLHSESGPTGIVTHLHLRRIVEKS